VAENPAVDVLEKMAKNKERSRNQPRISL